MTPVLGYWSFRGYAQPIRYLLEYTSTAYVDKQYDIGPGPCYSKTDWTKDKDDLCLDDPSLPYYIDDNVRLTDALTILRYLAKMNKLDGTTTDEKNNLEEVVKVINERNGALDMLFYTSNYENDKEKFLEGIVVTMEQLSTRLRSNKFITGKRITFADFMLFEMLERYELLDAECLAPFSNLQGLKQRFSELPTIKSYINSPAFRKIKERVNARMARCGVGWYFGTERNI